MAHKIYRNSMMYVAADGKPWHGIGTELQAPATAKEAIVASGMDYTVDKQDIYVGRNGIKIADHVATVRTDTNKVLGVVGDGYQVVQNREAFDFFDTIVGEGQAIYHTAGVLGQGERVWLMAQLPGDITITREDIVKKNLVLTNSHDGSSALLMFFTPIRVVCWNTLTQAIAADGKTGIKIRHSGNIGNKVNEARRVLGITIKYYETFEEIAKFLASTQLSVEDVDKYYTKILGLDQPREKESAVLENRKLDLLQLFEHGKGNDLPGIKGSAWSAFNGFTEYIDHYKSVRNQEADPTNRLKSIWFGAGASMKAKAFDEAVVLAKSK